MNLRKLFEKGNVGLGWSALWRITLLLLPLNVLARFAAEAAALNPHPLAGLAMLLALPIGGNLYLVPLAIPVTLLAWNWIGKLVLRKRLGFSTGRFIGWAVYWRVALLQFAGIAALSIVFVPVTLLAQKSGDRTQMVIMGATGMVLMPALVYWSLNTVGFVLRRLAALLPATVEPTEQAGAEGPVRVRDYRALFDRSSYGTNWMLAAAYLAAGLAGTLAYPAVQAMFGGSFSYGTVADMLPVHVLSWAIAGAGLSLVLHRCSRAWHAVVLFAVLMVLLRVFEAALLQSFVVDFSGLQILDPLALTSRAFFAALFCAGLLAGIRLWGPTALGFALGIGSAQLAHILLVYPTLAHLIRDMPLETLWDFQRIAIGATSTVVDAAITGVAFWWACDWHLQRRGLHLNQQGMIQHATETAEAASA